MRKPPKERDRQAEEKTSPSAVVNLPPVTDDLPADIAATEAEADLILTYFTSELERLFEGEASLTAK